MERRGRGGSSSILLRKKGTSLEESGFEFEDSWQEGKVGKCKFRFLGKNEEEAAGSISDSEQLRRGKYVSVMFVL